MNLLKKNSGSVLIEAMVGLSLIVMSFTGIVALVSRGFQLNVDALNKFIATNLATEGIEIVKNALDTDLYKATNGWDGTNRVNKGMYEVDYSCDVIDEDPCVYFPTGGRSVRFLKRSDSGVYSYEEGTIETPFKRSVVVDVQGDAVLIYSIVEWDNRGTREEVQISNTFMNWRKNPS